MNNLEKRLSSSRFSVNKNFLWFLIAPFLVILIGAIMLCTCGYNLGYDFTGGTTFRMFVNKDNEVITTVDNYDLEKSEDYSKVYNKISEIIRNNDGKIVSYKTTGMSVLDYNIVDGQAIEVTFQNKSTDKEEIETQNQVIKSAIIETFGLDLYEKAVSEFDIVGQKANTEWMTTLICCAILAFVAGLVYVMARYSVSASIVGILMLAFDVFMMLSLLIICRVPVNMTLGAIILTTTLISLFNLFAFYRRVRDGEKSGKFEKLRNSEIADKVANEQSFIRTLIYIVLAVILLVLIAVSVDGVRFTALGMLFAFIVTYYNSQFILPSLFAVCYKKRKKKRV